MSIERMPCGTSIRGPVAEVEGKEEGWLDSGYVSSESELSDEGEFKLMLEVE